MRLKRAASLLLAIPLLLANILRADIACATPAPAGQSAPVGSTGSDFTHHEHATTPADDRDESCDAPVPQDCCPAVASCSFAFGVRDDDTGSTSAREHRGALAALIRMPLSRVAPPDPPPPKA